MPNIKRSHLKTKKNYSPDKNFSLKNMEFDLDIKVQGHSLVSMECDMFLGDLSTCKNKKNHNQDTSVSLKKKHEFDLEVKVQGHRPHAT